MKDIALELPFSEDPQMPGEDFNNFIICNQAPKFWTYKEDFYKLKTHILRHLALYDHYDLQIIDYACWHCRDGSCGTCTDGIYQRRRIALERRILNGHLFHIPIGQVTAEGYVPTLNNGGVRLQYRHQIKGLIKHAPFPADHAKAYRDLCAVYRAVLAPWLPAPQMGVS